MLLEQGQVFLGHFKFQAQFFPLLLGVVWIFTTGLHIDEEIVFPIFLHGFPVIARMAGMRIVLARSQHTADLVFWVYFMGDFGRNGRGYQLMMGCLVFDQIFIFPFFKAKASPHKWRVENHIDFVEG